MKRGTHYIGFMSFIRGAFARYSVGPSVTDQIAATKPQINGLAEASTAVTLPLRRKSYSSRPAVRACLLALLMIAAPRGNGVDRNPLLTSLETALVAKTFMLRDDFNIAPKQYYKLGETEFICRHALSGLFPKQQPLVGVAITRVRQVNEIELLRRNSKMEGKKVVFQDATKEFRCWSFTLKHPHLGKGELVITTASGQLPERQEDIFEILGFVLTGNRLPIHKRLRAKKGAALVHFVGSGHAPDEGDVLEFDDRDEAQRMGYKECSLCFNSRRPLAYATEERKMGDEMEATIRHYSQVSKDGAIQERVERLGRKILSRWPTRLMGYDYHFNVIDKSDFNAGACPGGWIFLNRGLVDAMESDEELESVLAHEIAHVEQRHAIKQLLRAKRDQDAAALFSAVLGGGFSIAASVATKNDAGTATRDAAQVAGSALGFWIYALGAEIGRQGYSREHETEADVYAMIYFKKMGYPRSHFLSMLRKLRTSVNIQDPTMPDEADLQLSHPTPNNRLHVAESIELEEWHGPVVFDALNSEGELVYTITFQGVCYYQTRDGTDYCRVLIDVVTADAIGKPKTTDAISLSPGSSSRIFRSDGAYTIAPLDRLGMSFTYKGKLRLTPDDITMPRLEGISVSKVSRRSPLN